MLVITPLVAATQVGFKFSVKEAFGGRAVPNVILI
jgi:hypothetical protein